MAVDKEKIESVLAQLPEHLQQQVLAFAESLVQKAASTNGTPQLQSLFGAWDSGSSLSRQRPNRD
jgi:hypothetical protein